MEMGEKVFEFEHKGYKVKGFTLPQREIGEFNREKEDELVKNCIKKVIDTIAEPNKYESRMARADNIPIKEPMTKYIHYNIIYKIYCIYPILKSVGFLRGAL